MGLIYELRYCLVREYRSSQSIFSLEIILYSLNRSHPSEDRQLTESRGSNSVKISTPVSQLESQDIKISKAYLVSCTNSRASDLAAAAKVFREAKDGPAKIHQDVKFYIAAASRAEQTSAEESGDWAILEEAGAIVLPAGCELRHTSLNFSLSRTE